MLQKEALKARRLKVHKHYSIGRIAEIFEHKYKPWEIETGIRKLKEASQKHYEQLAGSTVGIVNRESFRPDAEVVATQQARLMLRPQTVTALLMGDPLPGESALEKRA